MELTVAAYERRKLVDQPKGMVDNIPIHGKKIRELHIILKESSGY